MIGTNTMRPSARSVPMCRVRRRPQVNRASGITQTPPPTIIRIGAASDAPNRPSQLCTGASVASIQFGSSGE